MVEYWYVAGGLLAAVLIGVDANKPKPPHRFNADMERITFRRDSYGIQFASIKPR